MPARMETRPENPAVTDYLSAAEAARLLKIKAQTLYTYVSRGLIGSVAQADKKARLFYREDIEKVRARSAGWIAHVMEQRLAGFVLRPRARYVSSIQGAGSAPGTVPVNVHESPELVRSYRVSAL